jgi:hypothetical protein
MHSTGFAVTYAKPKSLAFDYRTSGTLDATAQTLHLKHSFGSLLGMTFTQAASGQAGPTFVAALKNAKPAHKVFQYTIETQGFDVGGVWAPFQALIDAGGTSGPDWWARAGSGSAYIAGGKTKAETVISYSAWEVNQTDYVTPNAAGDRWPQALARRYINNEFSALLTAGLDGIFNDNVWNQPGKGTDGINDGFPTYLDGTNTPANLCADYNLDGSNDVPTNTTLGTKFRQGYAAYWAFWKAARPGFLIMANADFNLSTYVSCLTTTELQGLADYGFIESLSGQTFSVATFSTMANVMARYNSQAAGSALGTIVSHSLDSTTDGLARTLQGARAGLCLTMLGDGVCSLVDKPGGADGRPYWINELDQLVGNPIDAIPSAAAPGFDGMWKREYDRALVIYNPQENKGRWMDSASGTLTLVRSANVVTLTWSAMPAHGKTIGDKIRITDCTTDSTFNGVFTITGVTGTTITWAQALANADAKGIRSRPLGYFELTSTVDLTGLGYVRILGTDDAHNDYLGTGRTSQNDGSVVTTATVFSNDGLMLLKA